MEDHCDRTRIPISGAAEKGRGLADSALNQEFYAKISQIVQERRKAEERWEQAEKKSAFRSPTLSADDPFIDRDSVEGRENLAWRYRLSFFSDLEKLEPEVLNSIEPLRPKLNDLQKLMGSDWSPDLTYRLTRQRESVSLHGALDTGDFSVWPPITHALLTELGRDLGDWSNRHNLTVTSNSPPWVLQCALV